MKIQRYLFSIFIITLVFTSCKTKRTVVQENINGLSFNQLVENHKATFPNYNTLASRVQVVYDDGKKQQSITVNLRMEKDKAIWLKASILGITLAKAYITPNRVSYYETLGNTYFDGDFSLLSDWLGTPLNFNKTQALLLGQSLFNVTENEYSLSEMAGLIKVEPKKQPFNFIHSFFINPSNYRVKSASVSQPQEKRLFTLNYEVYQTINEQLFPSTIQVQATDNEDQTKIEITYKSIDVNAPVSFPFTIPNGYDEIRLN